MPWLRRSRCFWFAIRCPLCTLLVVMLHSFETIICQNCNEQFILRGKLELENGMTEFIFSIMRLSHTIATCTSLWQSGKPSWQSTLFPVMLLYCSLHLDTVAVP